MKSSILFINRTTQRILSHGLRLPFYLLNLHKIESPKFPSLIKNDWTQKVSIKKHPDSIFRVNGKITFTSWMGDRSETCISLGKGSELTIDGDIVIGPNCFIHLSENAKLSIGGKKHESASGFTGNVKIMVAKEVHIGYDLICAWNVFITDCDWHTIEGATPCMATHIEDHVWITPNCSILKGSYISKNSIVANGSVTTNKRFEESSLIVGSPAKRIRSAPIWNRDLKL